MTTICYSILPKESQDIMTIQEKTAVLCFLRMERFVEGYFIDDDLSEKIAKFFGNLEKLYNEGLVQQYRLMRSYVIKHNLIGLFLYGKYMPPDKSRFLHDYITENKRVIRLSTQSISSILIEHHFKYNEVQRLCIKTDNYDVYK